MHHRDHILALATDLRRSDEKARANQDCARRLWSLMQTVSAAAVVCEATSDASGAGFAAALAKAATLQQAAQAACSCLGGMMERHSCDSRVDEKTRWLPPQLCKSRIPTVVVAAARR